MKYLLNINERELEVQLISRGGNTLSFAVDGEVYTSSLKPKLSERATPAASGAARVSANGNAIHAPMPGIIVSISIEEGTAYKTGDTALVIEAMKMENNIPFPAEARVTAIHVSEGDEVEAGQLLVELNETPS